MSNKADATDMSQAKKDELKPKWRFPEFRDAGEWKPLPIGKKVDLLSGYPFAGIDISEDSRGIKLLRGINITEGVIRHSQSIDRYYLGNAEKIEKYRLQDNDLVIAMDGSKVGKNSALITSLDSGALLVQRVARLRTDGLASIQFIFQQINSSKFHAYVDRINTSSGIPHISAKQINDFQICFPSTAEQHKIADCLSSLDDRLAAETQKLGTLKVHKKGLMQQLFPTEGETLPKLRFPEFRDAPEWELKQIKFICHMQAGKFVSASDIAEQHEKGLYPCYGGNGLRGYTGAYTHSGKYPLIGRQGALCGNVKLGVDRFYATEHAVVVTPKDNVDVNWLFYKLDFLNLNRYATGQAQPGVSVEVLEKIPVVVPETEKEQRKIADCLSSIDELMTAQTQKIDTLKAHKKGLMQQLFPALDEVTG